jgi:hypothetical protein
MILRAADFADALRDELAALPDAEAPALPRFLRALLGAAWRARDAGASGDEPSWDELLAVFVEALRGAPVELAASWLDEPRVPSALPLLDGGFDELEQVLIFQIADLHQLEMVGKLRDEWSLLGLASPSGALWNSFEFFLYCENGIEGLLQRAPEAEASWGALALLLECAREPIA